MERRPPRRGARPAPPDPPAGAPPSTAAATLPSSRRCVSRRRFRIRLRAPRGDPLTSARVFVNGKRVKVLRGNRLTAPIDLRGLPKGRFRVKVTATTRSGRSADVDPQVPHLREAAAPAALGAAVRREHPLRRGRVPRQRRRGRIGRGTKLPPQFGHTPPSRSSTQSAQNVHS